MMCSEYMLIELNECNLLIKCSIFGGNIYLYLCINVNKSLILIFMNRQLFIHKYDVECFFIIKLLLSLQIGLTPPSFATDGITWRVILAYGFGWIDRLKTYLSLVFFQILKLLFLLQGMSSWSYFGGAISFFVGHWF